MIPRSHRVYITNFVFLSYALIQFTVATQLVQQQEQLASDARLHALHVQVRPICRNQAICVVFTTRCVHDVLYFVQRLQAKAESDSKLLQDMNDRLLQVGVFIS